MTGLLASHDSLNETDSGVFSGALIRWWIFTAFDPSPRIPHEFAMVRVCSLTLDVDVLFTIHSH